MSNFVETIPSDFEFIAVPGVMLSNAWPDSRAERGATVTAARQVLEGFPFFKAYQTVDIPFADERREFYRLIKDGGYHHTYAITRTLQDRGINLSALDPDERRKSWNSVIPILEEAVESGAATVMLSSGHRPTDPNRRSEALKALEESLQELSFRATQYSGLNLEIEPMDVRAHKRGTLGTTKEAIKLCKQFEGAHSKLTLCMDTAHLLLNEEEVVSSVADARQWMSNFHICNAVVDMDNEFYGDWHLPFGSPGVLDLPQIAGILRGLYRIGYLSSSHRPRVFAEVRKWDGIDSIDVVEYCKITLEKSWVLASQLVEA